MAYQTSDDYRNMDLGNFRPTNTTVTYDGGIMESLRNLLGGDNSAFSSKSLFGGTNANGTQSMGWATPAIGIGQAIMGGINGSKQLKLAENNFKEGKRQFDLNYAAQRSTTNTQLEDRQRARVASNPGAYESVSAYLDKNRIK